MQAFLADGVLSSTERQVIRAYEDSIFNAQWQLRDLPHYETPRSAHSVGEVRFGGALASAAQFTRML